MPSYYTDAFDASGYQAAQSELSSDEERWHTAFEHALCTGSETVLQDFQHKCVKPTLSIVVPAHNASETIERCLTLLGEQGGQGWECIVVDDASTDDTAHRVRRAMRKDKRIKLVRHFSVGGMSSAHDTGLRCARGSYLCFLQPDQVLMTGALRSRLDSRLSQHSRVHRTADLRRRGSIAAAEQGEHSGGPVDILFLPHKDYHVWTLSLVLPALKRAGLRYLFVDPQGAHRDEGATEKLADLELPRISFNAFMLADLQPKMVVCMNDWDPINRRIIQSCRGLGIATVGVVEGVQDYLDADTGRARHPYQHVEYVLLPGAFDARYFPAAPQKVRVGGVPRIDELCLETPCFPATPLVVINSNFTYNVLTDKQQDWLRLAVDACEALGYDYRISKHPADRGDFSAYKVGDESMYELIRGGSVFVSRFGSGILESLAMGKPAVYLNSHGEEIDKFKEPKGAFPIATDLESLISALRLAVESPQTFLDQASEYLQLHCDSGGDRKATETLGRELLGMFHSAPVPPASHRSRLHALLLHKEEMTLGAVDFESPGHEPLARPNTRQGLGLGRKVIEGSDDLWRKYRKLRRDPKGFLLDSHSRGLNLLGKLL